MSGENGERLISYCLVIPLKNALNIDKMKVVLGESLLDFSDVNLSAF